MPSGSLIQTIPPKQNRVSTYNNLSNTPTLLAHNIKPVVTLMPAKKLGERIDVRCTRCGARNMKISEEFLGSSDYEVQAGKINSITFANELQATGRLFGRCRQCGHDWVFRKNPFAS